MLCRLLLMVLLHVGNNIVLEREYHISMSYLYRTLHHQHISDLRVQKATIEKAKKIMVSIYCHSLVPSLMRSFTNRKKL